MSRVLRWGVVGLSNTWTAFGEDAEEYGSDEQAVAGYGIRRILDPGTVYREQPPVEGLPRWVEKPGSRARVFDMEWQEDAIPETMSLLDLRDRIAPRRKGIAEDDADLSTLDECIQVLVDGTGRLHSQGASLGFVQPDSVRFWTRHDGSRAVVLPDVGFAWDDAGGLLEPEWLAQPPCGFLFDHGARRRNREYLEKLKGEGAQTDLRKRAKESGEGEAEDVRLIARLIALTLAGAGDIEKWCGSSKVLLKIPGKDRAADTEAPIWDDVIAPALAGQITTCKELQLRLAGAKPSEHFLYAPPKPPWKGWAVLRPAAKVLAGVVLIALLWVLKGFFPPVDTPPYCVHVPSGISLYGDLFDLEDLQAAVVIDDARYAEYWEQLLRCLHDHRAFKGCDDDCLRGLVESHFNRLGGEAEEILSRLRALPRPTVEECGTLQAITDKIMKAEDAVGEYVDVETPMIQEVLGRLARQTQLRGCEPRAGNSNAEQE